MLDGVSVAEYGPDLGYVLAGVDLVTNEELDDVWSTLQRCRTVCLGLFRCFFPDASSDELISPADIYIPFGSDVDAWKPDQVDCYITCQQSEGQAAGTPPKSVKLLSDANEVLASADLESLPVAKGVKGVGMCLGPVYSYIPQFVDWLTYWSAMGISGIHAYSPVLDHKKGSGFYRPTFLMHHFLLEWTLYKPLPHSHYFGQRPLYNDCIYRHRHLYDFIFMWDADEFIHFPKRFPDSLLTWLSTTVPANTSGASLQIAEYNVECKNQYKRPMNVPVTAKTNFTELYQTYSGYSVFQMDLNPPPLANCTDQGWCLVKSLVRPLAILAYNVHHPQAVYEGWVEATVHVDPGIAFYKHLRCVWKDETV